MRPPLTPAARSSPLSPLLFDGPGFRVSGSAAWGALLRPLWGGGPGERAPLLSPKKMNVALGGPAASACEREGTATQCSAQEGLSEIRERSKQTRRERTGPGRAPFEEG